MKKLKLFFLYLLLTCGWIGLNAVVAHSDSAPLVLTLKKTLQLADERDVRMIVSQERFQQSLARIAQNRAFLFPQINVQASQMRQTRDLRTAGITLPGDPLVGPFNSFDARGQIIQTIFDPAAVARLKAARANEGLSSSELRKTREDVLALVAIMFIDARLAEQNQDYARAVFKKAEKKLTLVKKQWDLGTVSALDLQQAQAEVAAAETLFQQTRMNVNETRSDLLAALGFDLDQPVQFASENELVLGKVSSAQDASLRFPDVEVAREELNLRKIQQSIERYEYWPKVSALADYGPSGVDPSNKSETYSLGVKMSWPIWDGGLRSARLQEEQSRFKEGQAQLAYAERQAQTKIFNSGESLNRAQALVEEKKVRWAVAQTQLKLMEQRHADGSASDMDILDAQVQEARAQEEAREAEADLLTVQIHLWHAQGNMTAFIEEPIAGKTQGTP